MTNLLPRLEFLAQALFRRTRDCPHCGWQATGLIARKHFVVRVRRCPRCAICFTDPLYDRSAFGSLYDERYGAEGSTTDMPGPERLEQLLRTSFAGTDKDCHDRLRRLRAVAPGDRLLEVGRYLWMKRLDGQAVVPALVSPLPGAKDRRLGAG